MANLTPGRDERTYEQLAEVLRRQLPPVEWTDHNASDPGVMLLELFSWLGEMALYRMERVPETHQQKFLNYIIDPPEPVTIDLTFRATFQPAPATPSLTIPAGTLVATDFAVGRRFVFETFQSLDLIRPPATVPPVAQDTVKARAILQVFAEPVGVSDASPQQQFALRPPRISLGITEPDAPAPILTDFLHRTGTYEPNPRVTVGGSPWTAVPALRTEGSRVTALNPATHFMVDANESLIRFGDGVFGAIPPAGSLIQCDRYAVLDGPAALSVGQDAVRHLLNFVPPVDVALTLGNTDAEGGMNFFPVSRRTELGLREFRAPYRLITEHDFERAIMADFNAFQELSGRSERIVRASVEFNRRSLPEGDVDAPGWVSLVLLAGSPDFDEVSLRDESVALATRQATLAVPPALWQRLRRFLDPRRLITTRLALETPQLRPLSVAATVAVTGDRNLVRVQAELLERVSGFLSLSRGDFDGRGWRLGRSVYRSQLFRLIEDADSVDHVVTLSLSLANAQGNVILGPHELPLLQSLTLTVVRA